MLLLVATILILKVKWYWYRLIRDSITQIKKLVNSNNLVNINNNMKILTTPPKDNTKNGKLNFWWVELAVMTEKLNSANSPLYVYLCGE